MKPRKKSVTSEPLPKLTSGDNLDLTDLAVAHGLSKQAMLAKLLKDGLARTFEKSRAESITLPDLERRIDNAKPITVKVDLTLSQEDWTGLLLCAKRVKKAPSTIISEVLRDGRNFVDHCQW